MNDAIRNLKQAFNEKINENGDISYRSIGSNIEDIFGMAVTYQESMRRNSSINIPVLTGSNTEKLLACYIRDPRFGQGFKKLGRYLADATGLTIEERVKSGSYKDLVEKLYEHESFKAMYKALLGNPKAYDSNYYKDQQRKFMNDKEVIEIMDFLWKAVQDGDNLAKKWMPRFHKSGKKGEKTVSKSMILAKMFALKFNANKSEYGKLMKTPTIESTFSQATKENGQLATIEFGKVPSNATLKYKARFARVYEEPDGWRDIHLAYENFISAVEKGEAKVNVGAINVVDIYKSALHNDGKDVDVIANSWLADRTKALEGKSRSWIPITDTSSSMSCVTLSNGLTALQIGAALSWFFAKTSTYAPNTDIVFDSDTKIIQLDPNYGRGGGLIGNPQSKFSREINSMYTGRCGSTNFAKVLECLRKLDPVNYPDYFIVVSDMEFNGSGMAGRYYNSESSHAELNKTFKYWREQGIRTSMVWWNVNNRNTTNPCTSDEWGNIFISGFNPAIVDSLCDGEFIFDNKEFIQKALTSYAKKAGFEYLIG